VDAALFWDEFRERTATVVSLVTLWVSRFFRWWGTELAGCLPGGLRRLFGRRRPRLVVEVRQNRAVFSSMRGGGLQHLGDLDLQVEQGPALAAMAKRILRGARPGSTPLEVRMPKERVLRRIVELPSAAAENLREVLAFEMDRHTPFRASEVYYDHQVTGGGGEQPLRVDLVVVPRAAADQAIDLVRGWGLEPQHLGVVPAEEDGNGAPSFDLLPSDNQVSRRSFSGRLSLVLAISVCGLLGVAVYLPLLQQQDLLAASETRLRQARAEAEVAQSLQERVEATVERSRFVEARRSDRPTVSALLDEVSTLLPDDTWVLQLGWRDERLVLSGYSVKPSALIGLLEESEMLAEVRFSSPVTRDAKVDRERFNLTATVVEAGDS
jgi:general secretion pathway protein L